MLKQTPTVIDITDLHIERAAVALLACEAQSHLTDCCGRASLERARIVANAVLIAALDLRYNEL